ncbi:MAG: hypothetical protein ABSC02_03245 [Acidobacteriota bacterium]|jgi:hypothetical protein
MTRLYVDKQEVAAIPQDLNSLDQVIRLVERDHINGDAIIRQIQIDGHPLIPDGNTHSLPDCIANKEKIEIFTGTLQEVALDSIQEAIAYLDRVEATTPVLANSFRNSIDASTFENLKQFYEGFYWINLLIDRLAQTFHVPLDAGEAGGALAGAHHAKLTSALKALIEAHEKMDFGLMADLLEYEITPLIQGSKEIFTAIRGRILSEGSNSQRYVK